MGIKEYLKYVDFEEIVNEMNELKLMDEYIGVELMCLSDSQYKHMFDFSQLKKVIIGQEIGEIDFSIKTLLIEKIDYLLESNKDLCNICLKKLTSNKYDVCTKHLPSYCLFDETDTEIDSESEVESDSEVDIYPEYTKEELRELIYKDSKGEGYEDECCDL